MHMSRRLFVVLLANNDHGKSSLVKSLLSQGLGQTSHKPQKGHRALVSPWGREIDAFVFVRSFQETEKAEHETIVGALDANDPHWRERELILFPSHVNGDISLIAGKSLLESIACLVIGSHAGFGKHVQQGVVLRHF